jgi:hypothetical protein
VDLAQSWFRQVARAAGASLIAPLAIVLAAAVVAVGGGGLGGISSLTQIASGPDAPATGVAPGGLADAGVIAPEERERRPAARPATAEEPEPQAEVETEGGIETPTLPPVTGQPNGGVTVPDVDIPPPTGTTPSRPAPNPVGDLVGNVGESVPTPLQPVTQGLLQLLLAPIAPPDTP